MLSQSAYAARSYAKNDTMTDSLAGLAPLLVCTFGNSPSLKCESNARLRSNSRIHTGNRTLIFRTILHNRLSSKNWTMMINFRHSSTEFIQSHAEY